MPLPDWPDLSTGLYKQFVNYFGQAADRRREPDIAYPDELKFCNALRGLRFDHLEKHHVGLQGARYRLRCAFRRLFCDGQAAVRLEVGLATVPIHNSQKKHIRLQEILCVACGVAKCPTIVPNPKYLSIARPIIMQGKALARLFAHASMNKIKAEHVKIGEQLVEVGDPLILVELDPDESLKELNLLPINGGFQVVDNKNVNGTEALFCRLDTTHGIVSMWILLRESATKETIRSLRICLLRLHAEMEVLDIITKQLDRKRLLYPPLEDAAELLDAYFNDRTHIIYKDKWMGVKQSEYKAAMDAFQCVVRPASREQLIKRYEGSRRQVWNKLQKFQEERRTIRHGNSVTINNEGGINLNPITYGGTGNIFNVAEYMSNVTSSITNNLENSSANSEISDLIIQLKDQVQEIANESDPKQIKKMGKNLELLSKEVSEDEPDRAWYSVSLKGLKEAAENVGKIADPILKTVKKISALLL